MTSTGNSPFQGRFGGLRRLFRLPASLGRVDRYVDDELQFHFESRISDLVASGVSLDDARRIAEREYGDVAASRTELAAVDRRIVTRQRRADLLDVLRQDISYALRGLRRSPGLTATIILTLGLGVGANAAVFTALDRVFFQAPPGVVDPGAVRRLYAHRFDTQQSLAGPAGQVTPFLSSRDLIDLGTAARGTAQIAGYDLDRGSRLEPENEPVRMTFVSPGYFDFVGVRAARGRFFAADENRLPGPPVPLVVISDAFWRNHFAADSSIVGKTVRVNETSYTIIGVAPRNFEGLELEVTDLWTPLSNEEGGSITWLRILARIDRGTDPRIVDQILTRQYRQTHVGDRTAHDSSAIITAPILAARGPALGVNVRRIPGMSERSLGILERLAGGGLVVALIAIANAASLLLMRAVRRRREIAVRIALGISRSRLVAQLVIESTILGAAAGGAALVAASLTGNALRIQLAGFRWSATVVDHRVVLFGMGIAIVGGMLAGLAPAAFALRTDVSAALRSSSSGGTRAGSATRSALLVTQSALCMMLLASSGVFLQSLRRAEDADRGFDPERMILLSLPAYYPTSGQEVARVAERIRGMPGIEAVGRSNTWLAAIGMLSKVGPTGADTIGASARGPSIEFVEPDLLQAAGFRIMAGRLLAASDNAARVAIINQSLAAALFPGKNAVGTCIHVREPRSPCRTVIGVVGDVLWNVTEPAVYRVYIPLEQAWATPNPALIPNYLVVRTDARTSGADVARLRALVAPMISGGAELGVRQVSDMLEPELQPWRLAATLFLIMGLLGLAAAAAGIYGLVAYDVTQRSREIGVRVALGATSAGVVRLVVSAGLRVVLLGTVAGAIAALVAGRVMASLLFATSPYDPTVLVVTALTLAATAVLASIIPAWRAIRVDPVIVLSSE